MARIFCSGVRGMAAMKAVLAWDGKDEGGEKRRRGEGWRIEDGVME